MEKGVISISFQGKHRAALIDPKILEKARRKNSS
jgi:hypothetical protein